MVTNKAKPKKVPYRKSFMGTTISVKAKHVHVNPVNPYDITNYDDFSDTWANTIAGQCTDIKVDFTIGGGVKPVLDLIEKGELKEQQVQDKLRTFSKVTDRMEQIDDQVNFNAILKDAMRMAKVYGRCVIAFEPDGESIGNDDFALKIIHPTDLGKVKLNEDNWKIESVGVGTSGSIKAEDMIYIVNMVNTPVKNSLWYGFSELQRVIGAAKALRRLIEFDAPEIAESMWANYGIILNPTQGLTKSEADSLNSAIADNLTVGAWNVMSKREGMEIIQGNLDAKTNDIVTLWDRYERLIIGNSTVPGALVGREEEANRATLLGKIQLFVAGPIKSEREWLGNHVTNQWYKKIMEKEFSSDKEKVRVSAEFEPIIVDNWSDSVDAVQKLKATLPSLPEKVLLKLLNLEELENELEQPAPKIKVPTELDSSSMKQVIAQYIKEMRAPGDKKR